MKKSPLIICSALFLSAVISNAEKPMPAKPGPPEKLEVCEGLPVEQAAPPVPQIAICRAAPVPLKQRVEKAKLVFIGKLVEREEKGDWVHAELVVSEPVFGAKKDERVKVVWRKKIGERLLYDLEQGQEGIAILNHKKEDRYYLGEERFEGMDQLEKLREVLRDGISE